MLASLPWYDFAETYEYNDRIWSLFRQHYCSYDLSPLPEKLDRSSDQQFLLTNNNLFLTQTCGYDLACSDPMPLAVVATPIYKTDGAANGQYSSFLVKRKNEDLRNLKNLRFVANDNRSFSGYHCVVEIFSEAKLSTVWSGCHLQSLNMIANDEADWAAIDVVTWGLLKKYRPQFLEKFTVISQTRVVAAPPLVTIQSRSLQDLQNIQRALVAMSLDGRGQSALRSMLIEGFRYIPADEYRRSLRLSSRQNQELSLQL